MVAPEERKGRGFKSMSVERRREVQSKGGRNAQRSGKCPRWTPEQASAAGRKARMMDKLKMQEQEQKGETCNTYHTTA